MATKGQIIFHKKVLINTSIHCCCFFCSSKEQKISQNEGNSERNCDLWGIRKNNWQMLMPTTREQLPCRQNLLCPWIAQKKGSTKKEPYALTEKKVLPGKKTLPHNSPEVHEARLVLKWQIKTKTKAKAARRKVAHGDVRPIMWNPALTRNDRGKTKTSTTTLMWKRPIKKQKFRKESRGGHLWQNCSKLNMKGKTESQNLQILPHPHKRQYPRHQCSSVCLWKLIRIRRPSKTCYRI